MYKRLDKHTTERIESLINQTALIELKFSISKITEDMLEEGWEYEEIRDYLLDLLELHLYKAMDCISEDTDGILSRADEANNNNDFYENGDPDDCDPAGGYGLNSHI